MLLSYASIKLKIFKKQTVMRIENSYHSQKPVNILKISKNLLHLGNLIMFNIIQNHIK